MRSLAAFDVTSWKDSDITRGGRVAKLDSSLGRLLVFNNRGVDFVVSDEVGFNNERMRHVRSSRDAIPIGCRNSDHTSKVLLWPSVISQFDIISWAVANIENLQGNNSISICNDFVVQKCSL
eukprot:TRINITY_DN12597_c0_g1_i2.p1 TRINITY_DN12597_c0_g1~~TRINITY_DN12597_c0_g1_i2.p1  ORF type:complete len:122 (+),score=7.05 TRINITY_DN12597_c0_g1_i2:146-511(+)